MSLGVGAAAHPGAVAAETLTSSVPGLSKRERKRKSDTKTNVVVNNSAPINSSGHPLTRDERKALALGLPISVQVKACFG